jgi:hypothetical protein
MARPIRLEYPIWGQVFTLYSDAVIPRSWRARSGWRIRRPSVARRPGPTPAKRSIWTTRTGRAASASWPARWPAGWPASYAYCLTANPYHLLFETPEADLRLKEVTGPFALSRPRVSRSQGRIERGEPDRGLRLVLRRFDLPVAPRPPQGLGLDGPRRV